MFEPFKFTPAHQPVPESPIVFELKPLDNPTLFRLVKAYAMPEGLAYDDLTTVLRKNVIRWSDGPVPYSPAARATFLDGEGNLDRQFWIAQCAQELYNRAILKEPERKNS